MNRGNPFAQPIVTPDGTFDYADRVLEMFKKMQLDALVCIGGDGTLAIAYEFYKMGIPLVCVPKTIDNDIVGTTSCFGFDTAVSFATDAIDRLHTTAEAHHRVMVVEVMGGMRVDRPARRRGGRRGRDSDSRDSLRPREGGAEHSRPRQQGRAVQYRRVAEGAQPKNAGHSS